MKRGDLVYSKQHGICVVMAPAAAGDSTIAIVAWMFHRDDAPSSVDFGILNEHDAVPIEVPRQLEDLRQWLTTGRKAP